jgi:hypothetical protein
MTRKGAASYGSLMGARGRVVGVAACLSLIAPAVHAEPTRVLVRAQALDAKFIGDHMGGVRVSLTDTSTGKVLAQGLTKGGTGDTARIMKSPHVRGAELATAEAAGFEATLDLARPTLVRVHAEGPAGKPASAVSTSATMWVIPGRDVLGDGWLLTLAGLVIEPTVAPDGRGGLRIDAKVTLMCGCPIEAGGLWDAANYTVEARLFSGNREVAKAPLAFTGETSRFAGSLASLPPGHYRLELAAFDRQTPNAGVISQAVDIPRTTASSR